VEQADVSGRKAPFPEDGLHVPARERAGVDDRDREADHAVAPLSGGVFRGRTAVASRATGAERA